jgi:hypothetical protein
MRFVAGQQHHEDFQLQSWQGDRTPLQEEVAVISNQLQHRVRAIGSEFVEEV